MSGSELIVDDEYCKKACTYIEKENKVMSDAIKSYISILKTVSATGIKKGDVAESLKVFIDYAGKIDNCLVETVATPFKTSVNEFLELIDEKDQFLF